MSTAQLFKDRNFLAVIGDEVCVLHKATNSQDSVTGLLLAGIGHITPDQKKNFLIVDTSNPSGLSRINIETEVSTIERNFEDFTTRKDVAILLVNQHVRSSPLFETRGLFADNRLPKRYGIESINTQLHFPQFWRFRAKTIHTVSQSP